METIDAETTDLLERIESQGYIVTTIGLSAAYHHDIPTRVYAVVAKDMPRSYNLHKLVRKLAQVGVEYWGADGWWRRCQTEVFFVVAVNGQRDTKETSHG